MTAIAVFDSGSADPTQEVTAGQIAQLWGLADVQIGDRIGEASVPAMRQQFPPPTLESVVVPPSAADAARLRFALAQLAEQDPLINVRQNDRYQEISVSLYGEVQKEVIQATLANDYDLAVTFSETTPIYVERPAARGDAVELLHAESNPFNAVLGLRVEPASEGAGVRFDLAVDARDVPLYVYKTLDRFAEHMEEYVRDTLREGLYGWEVIDAAVTMTACNYCLADGPPSRRGPTSTAADFRKLTPIVLMEALEAAGTLVCEPTVRATIDVPTETLGALIPALARLQATADPPTVRNDRSRIEAVLSAARADELQRELAGLTHGEGVLDSTFLGYQPVSGDPPTRRRTTANPLNLAEYVADLAGRPVGRS